MRSSDTAHMGRPIGRGLPDLAASSRQLPRTACKTQPAARRTQLGEREKPPRLGVGRGVVARVETLAINNPGMRATRFHDIDAGKPRQIVLAYDRRCGCSTSKSFRAVSYSCIESTPGALVKNQSISPQRRCDGWLSARLRMICRRMNATMNSGVKVAFFK